MPSRCVCALRRKKNAKCGHGALAPKGRARLARTAGRDLKSCRAGLKSCRGETRCRNERSRESVLTTYLCTTYLLTAGIAW